VSVAVRAIYSIAAAINARLTTHISNDEETDASLRR